MMRYKQLEKQQSQAVEQKSFSGKRQNLSDTSLSPDETFKKYHYPDESTDYSVTLWGGAHFEGVRPCSNKNCPKHNVLIPVGKMKFWTNDFEDGAWFFFCSQECLTEVYTAIYDRTHQNGEPAGFSQRRGRPKKQA